MTPARQGVAASAGGEREPRSRLGLVVSLSLHAGIALALVATPAPRRRAVETAPPFEVEIVAEPAIPAAGPARDRDEAATPPRPDAAVAALPPATAPATPAAPVPPAPSGRLAPIRPTRLLSAQVLADPANRSALKAMETMAGEDRMVELCGIEAMEQIRVANPAYRPDRVVAHALADLAVVGDAITADGAAFRSQRRWYRLQFRCELAAGGRAVAGFAFTVGAAIARRDWVRHGLETEEGPAD